MRRTNETRIALGEDFVEYLSAIHRLTIQDCIQMGSPCSWGPDGSVTVMFDRRSAIMRGYLIWESARDMYGNEEWEQYGSA